MEKESSETFGVGGVVSGFVMVNIVPVDFKRHARKGWRRPIGYKFAAKDAVIALVASEFPRAALSLPMSSMIFRSRVNLPGWNFKVAASSSSPSREESKTSRLIS